MATLFKRPGRKHWIAQFYNHDRTQRIERSTGTTDRKLAERLAQKWEDRETERREGLVDVRAESLAAHQRSSLDRHLRDFLLYLEGKGTSEQTVDTAEARIKAILAKASAERIADLTPSRVLAAIKALRSPGVATPRGISNKTASHYVTAIKGFTRWLHRENRCPSDDLATLHGFNEQTDRRRVRRDMLPEELSRVLAVAEASPTVIVPRPFRNAAKERKTGTVRMTCPDRVWAYRVAAGTGFRASEVASLTPESFNLDADPPTITVAAGYSKRRRTDVQPIRRDLAGALRGFLQGKTPGEPVFSLPKKKAALLLRADMDAARAAWIAESATSDQRAEREKSDFLRHTDREGRVVDFHGLRHTFITRIVETGASVKTAQELARHSTPMLTIGRYAHTRREELAGALESLPELMDLRVSVLAERNRLTDDHQHQHQQSERQAMPGGSSADDGVRTRPTNKARDKSRCNGALREPVRRGASDFRNAEGRTRTADLRVMNPAL